MEKEINHRGELGREERKGDHNPFISTQPANQKRDEHKEPEPNKRKRIRAYQRIDYWQ